MGNKGIRDMSIAEAEEMLRKHRIPSLLEKGIVTSFVGSLAYLFTSNVGWGVTDLVSANPYLLENFKYGATVAGVGIVVSVLSGLTYSGFRCITERKEPDINISIFEMNKAEKYLREHKDIPTTEDLEAMIDISGVQQ